MSSSQRKAGSTSELFYRRSFRGEDFLLADHANRVKSFHLAIEWPFLDNCPCTPEKMAEAGFYFVGWEKEPDLVRCYWCRAELDGWDPTDEPWAEHARRDCPFIKLGKKPHQLTHSDLLALEMEKHVCLFKVLKTKKMEELSERAAKVRTTIENLKKPAGKKSKRKKY